MSAEETKPVTTEAGVVEPTPAPAAVLTADTVADKVEPAAEPKAEEPAKTETEAEAAAPAEEKKEEKKEEKTEEPIYSGALGYKAPGLKNAFRYSKKYFWFGEEEPVSVQSLSNYLRGEKAEVAHPTAAWSSQTGKGLLYFVKHADQKATPAGVLNLAEATEVAKDGTVAFHFKLHGHKHAFEAQTLKERNGWFVAVTKAVEEAKAAKESVVTSEGYKEELTKLGKPATLAATAASSTPKKSVDAAPKKSVEAPKPTEGEATASDAAAPPARAGSSSSSSSDEDKKKKKASKSKSRSLSRGKRSSIFGGFLAKKDKVEEKAEEKKEEKKEEAEAKKETETPAAAPAAESSSVVAPTAPVIPPVEESKPLEEAKIVDAPIAAAAAEPAKEEKKAEEKKVEEKKVEEKPKPTKRGSIFGNFVEKLKSPTHEKKESDVAPAPPAKDPETTAVTLKKDEETPAAAPVPATDGTTEAPKVEAPKAEEPKPTASTTPHKEKSFSFGKFLGGAKEKVRSPSSEKAPEKAAEKTPEVPKVEEPAKTEETPAAAATTEPAVAAPVEPAAEAPKEEKTETPAATPAATPSSKPKRGSIFGNLTGGSVKKEGDSEKPQGLKGLFRNASKAGKSKKEKETPAAPAKVDETAEPKTEETPKVEEKKEEPVVNNATEPATIGDVPADAVTVGQAPKSTPQVSASA